MNCTLEADWFRKVAFCMIYCFTIILFLDFNFDVMAKISYLI